MSAVEAGVVEVRVERRDGGRASSGCDALAIEEPLEIRIGCTRDGRPERRSVSITMRTPGHDFDLAAGFLFTEGIVGERGEIEGIHHCGPPTGAGGERNIVRIDLRADTHVDWSRLERHFYTTSSCGICGKASIDALRTTSRYALPSGTPRIDASLIHALPHALREAQTVFDRTGGLHAAALFDDAGALHTLREDVGRHNAVDKVVGAELLAGRLPASDRVLMVSGRASFELVQKALMAGIPVLAAVGAPSSLAVALAESAGMTLLGFVRDDRFTIYTGAERVMRGVMR